MRTLVHSQIGGGNEFFIALGASKTLATMNGHLVVDNGVEIRKFLLAKFAFTWPNLLEVKFHMN
jgi:hypothetical protein